MTMTDGQGNEHKGLVNRAASSCYTQAFKNVGCKWQPTLRPYAPETPSVATLKWHHDHRVVWNHAILLFATSICTWP